MQYTIEPELHSWEVSPRVGPQGSWPPGSCLSSCLASSCRFAHLRKLTSSSELYLLACVGGMGGWLAGGGGEEMGRYNHLNLILPFTPQSLTSFVPFTSLISILRLCFSAHIPLCTLTCPPLSTPANFTISGGGDEVNLFLPSPLLHPQVSHSHVMSPSPRRCLPPVSLD